MCVIGQLCHHHFFYPGKRYMIINEVISTEAKYIDNLNTILTVFLPALEHVVTPRDLRLLVPAQLEVLMETHQELLDNLKQRMSGEAQFYGFVGDIFSRLCGHSNVSNPLKPVCLLCVCVCDCCRKPAQCHNN